MTILYVVFSIFPGGKAIEPSISKFTFGPGTCEDEEWQENLKAPGEWLEGKKGDTSHVFFDAMKKWRVIVTWKLNSYDNYTMLFSCMPWPSFLSGFLQHDLSLSNLIPFSFLKTLLRYPCFQVIPADENMVDAIFTNFFRALESATCSCVRNG